MSPNNELRPMIEKIVPQNTQNKVVTESDDNYVNSSAVSRSDSSKNTEDHADTHLKNPEIEVPPVTHEKIDDINSSKQSSEEKPIQNPQKSASETASTLEPSAEEDNALADIQEWVLHHCTAAGKLNGKKQFVRIPSGLLIRESSLKLLIKENSEYPSVDSVLKCLARYLEKEPDSLSVLVQYQFVQDAKKEIISGIILKNEYLCEPLKIYPENQFVENGV